jgi:hypothetical protein
MNNAFFVALTFFVFVGFVVPSHAQVQTLGTVIDQLSAAPLPIFAEESEGDFIDPDFLKDDGDSFDDFAKVSVRILDKITAESKTFTLDVGKTVAYGALRLRPMACKKSSPIDEPESASFLQIWEKMHEGTDEWIFSGWMFASSPSLSSMEHAVYDVWVIECLD